jgi:hypothetical protein
MKTEEAAQPINIAKQQTINATAAQRIFQSSMTLPRTGLQSDISQEAN